MSLLDQYEQQYAALVAEITAHIGRLQMHSSQVERRELCSTIDNSLGEANELLEQMGLEIRDLSSAQRAAHQNKLSVSQVELKRLQSEYRTEKDKQRNIGGTHTMVDLSESEFYDDVGISNDQRQRLLDNSERIERTGNRLTEAYRVTLETEAIGAQVLNDLSAQRETIQTARSRLRETNADLGRASRTLNSMMMRALREKVVLYGVGVCFVLGVAFSLYLTFSTGSDTKA